MNAAEQWHQEVSHLVQAHGADPSQLLGYVFRLGEIRWAHFDTHAALTVVGLRLPDGHVHPARVDLWPPMTIPRPYTALASTLPGDQDLREVAALRYRPFTSSPEVLAGPFEPFRKRPGGDSRPPSTPGCRKPSSGPALTRTSLTGQPGRCEC